MKSKNWFRTVIGSILVGIISSGAYDLIKDQPLLKTFLSVANYIVDLIGSTLNFQIKVWWILLFIIGLLLLIILISVMFDNEESKPTNPSYIHYKSAKFKNWIWKWDWYWNSIRKEWEIINLNPNCPNCNIELLDRSKLFRQIAICPKCERTFSDEEIEDTQGTKLLILDEVENGVQVTRSN